MDQPKSERRAMELEVVNVASVEFTAAGRDGVIGEERRSAVVCSVASTAAGREAITGESQLVSEASDCRSPSEVRQPGQR